MHIQKLKFSIDISADKETIWNALWDGANYRKWCAIFGEGSHYEANNLEEGSNIYFLDPNKNGIYSTILKHIPNNIITFKHIGLVRDGEEQPVDDETKKWSGTTETYILEEDEKLNTLSIDIDVLEEHLEFMKDKLPQALKKVQELCVD